MHETIICPDCQSQLVLPPVPAGQTVQCPRCQRVFAPSPQRAPVAVPKLADLYDDEADDVEPSTARLTRAEPLAGEWKATAALIALTLSVLSYGLQLYLGYERIEMIQTQLKLEEELAARGKVIDFGGEGRRLLREELQPGEGFPQVDEFRVRRERSERISFWSLILGHLTFWPALVYFMIWLYQATAATRVLQAEGFVHVPAQAVCFCFVPIMNLFWPHRILQDLWCASDPHAVRAPTSWTSVPSSLAIRGWCLFWLAYMTLAFICDRWATDFRHDFLLEGAPLFVARPQEQLHLAYWSVAATLCAIIAGVLLIGIIRAISRRQHDRYVRLYEDPA